MNFKRIESRTNPAVKAVCALHDVKGKNNRTAFFFEGVHLLEEYIRSGNTPQSLFVREDVFGAYSALISSAGCEAFVVTSSVYDKLSVEKAPQGILTVSGLLPNIKKLSCNLPEHASDNGAVVLDNLQDNGNVGTVIRTAASLGAAVALAGNCADIYSPKTIRASMGAVFTTEIYVFPSALSAISAFKNSGSRVFASALTEKSIPLGSFDILPTDCFVIGNEGKGLSEETINACDETVKIPMTGKTESLNAASAASVMLWELRRGRI